MVVGLLGLFRYAIDEVDGVDERGELVILDQLAVPEPPPDQIPQGGMDLILGQGGQLTPSSAVARAFSTTSSPSAKRPSSIVSGGRSLITLSYVPAFRTITP